MASPEEILAFWLDEMGPEGWYKGGEDLDGTIRERFESDWNRAMQGALSLWLTYASGTLAYIILTDQFPRNMFRGTAKSFSSDRLAKSAAKVAISKGWDMKIDPPARQFFYLPLEHSENQEDQDRAVRLFSTRMPEATESLLHAKAHREIIRQFGRFPFRNEALNRESTEAEREFLEEGGYGRMVEKLRAKNAA